ncbi:MAG TPA: hypothetical protein VKQ08_10315 [Cyclobacteriaceae bacterium]|nr:hypothetical protein [Cyclobacteriaceae bacterium]
MERLVNAGRKFYGLGLLGLGIQQFFYGDFLAVFVPAWSASVPGQAVWAYLVAAVLALGGGAIVLERKTNAVGVLLGGLFLLLFVAVHLPYQLQVNPDAGQIGAWTNSFKVLTLSGGAFVVAGSLGQNHSTDPLTGFLRKFIPLGRIFFAITLFTFGVDHFLYIRFVAALVPAWIPGKTFWAYFAGVALIGSGLGLGLKIKMKEVAFLTGLMIFLWFLVLHIPRAMADPLGQHGNEVTSVFEALAFSGIGFMLMRNSTR